MAAAGRRGWDHATSDSLHREQVAGEKQTLSSPRVLVVVLSAGHGIGLYSTREGVSVVYTAVDHYREGLDMPSQVLRGR